MQEGKVFSLDYSFSPQNKLAGKISCGIATKDNEKDWVWKTAEGILFLYFVDQTGIW